MNIACEKRLLSVNALCRTWLASYCRNDPLDVARRISSRHVKELGEECGAKAKLLSVGHRCIKLCPAHGRFAANLVHPGQRDGERAFGQLLKIIVIDGVAASNKTF